MLQKKQIYQTILPKEWGWVAQNTKYKLTFNKATVEIRQAVEEHVRQLHQSSGVNNHLELQVHNPSWFENSTP